MNTQRIGFTLVELLIGMVVGSLLLMAAYQALAAQNRSYRATGAMVQGQDALRIVRGVLESELQEVVSIGGDPIGNTDILMATSDSIRIRAPRKLGFICTVSPSDKSMTIWSNGQLFTGGDPLVLLVDGDISTFADDEWDEATVSSVSNSNTTCPTSPTGVADQKVTLVNHSLAGVSVGAPVRGFDEVTYGLYEFDGEWALGRRESDGELNYLVGGLGGPGEGLKFEYRDPSGAITTDRTNVGTIEISLTTAPHAGSGTDPMELTSTIFLRNQ